MEVLETVKRRFLVEKYCHGQYGGGFAYIINDLGKQLLEDVPTIEIISLVKQTRAEMEKKNMERPMEQPESDSEDST